MQSIQLQNDSLVEIATFLIRRWSEKENVIIEISDNIQTKTRLKEKKVIFVSPTSSDCINDRSGHGQEKRKLRRPCEAPEFHAWQA